MGGDAAVERVVVTGVGVVAPNGSGKKAFSRALRVGTSGIRFHDHLRDARLGCQVGGIPEGTDEISRDLLAPDELRAMNSNMVYAAIAAIEAWTDAGLARPAEGSDDVDWESGAVIGTGSGRRRRPGAVEGRRGQLIGSWRRPTLLRPRRGRPCLVEAP